MISVNATDFKNKLGQYLQKIYAEPIVINKMGQPTAVLLSYAEYERLINQGGSGIKTVLSEKEQALESIRQAFKGVRARGVEAS
ncbi:MAG: type II toxin-antitoxin system Phd/YefM family antitoxin [Gammaproteobacteria bacterium]|nr:type II toxin-antitoxin system Phd/YefM family antitoxin [Gammaproteobacteria bacterium]